MDPLRGCLALGPLGLYLFLLATLNLRRRPTLIAGSRDIAAMAVGFTGWMLVGPIELLLPQRALNLLAPVAWVAALSAYGIVVCLIVLCARRRLVIYNLPASLGRAWVLEVIEQLDPHSRLAGSTAVSPELGIEVRVHEAGWSRNVSLVSQGANDDPTGWQRLEGALAARLREVKAGPGFCGAWLLAAAAAMLGWVAWQLVSRPDAIERAFWEMLRMYD